MQVGDLFEWLLMHFQQGWKISSTHMLVMNYPIFGFQTPLYFYNPPSKVKKFKLQYKF